MKFCEFFEILRIFKNFGQKKHILDRQKILFKKDIFWTVKKFWSKKSYRLNIYRYDYKKIRYSSVGTQMSGRKSRDAKVGTQKTGRKWRTVVKRTLNAHFCAQKQKHKLVNLKITIIREPTNRIAPNKKQPKDKSNINKVDNSLITNSGKWKTGEIARRKLSFSLSS